MFTWFEKKALTYDERFITHSSFVGYIPQDESVGSRFTSILPAIDAGGFLVVNVLRLPS